MRINLSNTVVISLTIVFAAIFTSCKEPDTPTVDGDKPVIQLDLEGDMPFAYEGGSGAVSYSIINPVEGGTVSAVSSESWIEGMDCSRERMIIFKVQPNITEQERTATVTVWYTYGQTEADNVSAQFNVVQDVATVIEYDYELQAEYINGTYYGDMYGVNGEHSYFTILSDKSLVSGYLQEGGVYYQLDMFAGSPASSLTPLPPAGVYRMGDAGETALMTFTPDYTCRMIQHEGGEVVRSYFSDGTVTVATEGDNISFDVVLVDSEGKTHHVTYSGPVTYIYDDGNVSSKIVPLEKDLDIKGVSVSASCIGNSAYNVMEVQLLITDMNTDSQNYVIPPGGILYMDLFMPFSAEGRLTAGTYNFDNQLGNLNSLYPGFVSQVSEDIEIPDGTYAEYMEENGSVSTGLISSGSVTVADNGSGYDISAKFTTEEGYSITCLYSGSITVSGIPEPFSTLTEDYTLNLTGAEGTAEYYGDYYENGGSNWLISLRRSNNQGDGFMADIVMDGASFADGIAAGTYRVAAGMYPASGEYAPGQMSYYGELTGTMYYGGYAGGVYNSYAPAYSGDLIISREGDTYTLTFEFEDDNGNTWNGSWSGALATSDLSQLYGISGTAAPAKSIKVR